MASGLSKNPKKKVGVPVPHKVINQADADMLTPTDGVNMNTLINYTNMHGSGTDPFALHFNTQDEIHANLALKETPITTDMMVIEDSEDSWFKKRIPYSTPGTDVNAFHKNLASEIEGLTLKNNPVNADLVVIEDSEDGFSKKKAIFPRGGGTSPLEPVFITEGLQLTDADYQKEFFCDTTLDDIFILLPPINATMVGFQIVFVHTTNPNTAHPLQFVPSSSDSIIGGASQPQLPPWNTVTFVNDGISQWSILSCSAGMMGQQLIAENEIKIGWQDTFSLALEGTTNFTGDPVVIRNESHAAPATYTIPDISVPEANFVLTGNLNKVMLTALADSALTAPTSGTLVTEDYLPIQNTLHWDLADEIHSSIPLKLTPSSSDVLLLEDSEDGWAKKRTPFADFSTAPLSIKQWQDYQGALYMDETAFNSIYLFILPNAYSLAFLPPILPEYAGRQITVKIDVGPNWLSITPQGSGATINHNSLSYLINDLYSTVTFLCDGISNWIVFSSNGMQGTKDVDINQAYMSEYPDNATAKAHGLYDGQLYRNGDVLHIVHP